MKTVEKYHVQSLNVKQNMKRLIFRRLTHICVLKIDVRLFRITYLGKSQAKDNGHYKGHETISSIYALRFFDEVKNIPKDIIPRDIIETVLQHMAAHHGISPSVIEKNKLEPHVVGYIEQFNEIDEVSRITNMPRNEKIHSNK